MTLPEIFALSIITGRNEVVAKVMFLQVCVCPQGGRVSASVHAGMPYPSPPDQTDPPDQADPPRSGRPPPDPPGTWQTPTPRIRQTPPGTRQTPPPPGPGRHPPRDLADTPPPGPGRHPPQADSSIRSTSGRYASYWNAFLLLHILVFTCRFYWLLDLSGKSDKVIVLAQIPLCS